MSGSTSPHSSRASRHTHSLETASVAELAGRNGLARPVFAPVEAAALSDARAGNIVVYDEENISKGLSYDFNIIEWKQNADVRFEEMQQHHREEMQELQLHMEHQMQRHMEQMQRRMEQMQRRMDGGERNLCGICMSNPPNMRISCGHVFCGSCADRFTSERACPYRCQPNIFSPPRRVHEP